MQVKHIYIAISILLFLSCQSNHVIKDFEITRYRVVESGYEYSDDLLEYQGKFFSPILKESYNNGVLTVVDVYKSEATLTYTKSDILADTLLMKYLGLKMKRQLSIDDNHLLDNGDTVKITEQINAHKYYCFRNKEIRVYLFK